MWILKIISFEIPFESVPKSGIEFESTERKESSRQISDFLKNLIPLDVVVVVLFPSHSVSSLVSEIEFFGCPEKPVEYFL
jgi:hypothetical protein